MERKLANLFDRQRFERNAKLAGIVSDVENRYADALDDNDLELVNAADGNCVPTISIDFLLAKHHIPEDQEKKTW